VLLVKDRAKTDLDERYSYLQNASIFENGRIYQ